MATYTRLSLPSRSWKPLDLSQALICQFIGISKSKLLENNQDPTGIPVPVPVPVEFEPVPVDLAGTRPVPRFLFSERIFKVAKRTVENKYSLKSEIVEIYYFLREEKFKNVGYTPILQALTTVSVPVTESSTGTGSGAKAWYRYRYR